MDGFDIKSSECSHREGDCSRVCKQRGEDIKSRKQVRLVRAKAVYEHGGVYFDWDVHALRDLKPLREAGFVNVVGLEKYGNVGTGCYMSMKGSELMRLWLENQHIVYDGGWITHAVTLFNKMSRRLAAIPGEVLILAESAFAPSSWELQDME